MATSERQQRPPSHLWTLGLPWLATGAIVLTLAQPTLWWDEWDLADWWLRVRSTGLDLPALWMQHNEHRLVLGRLLFYLSEELGLGPIALMLVSHVFLGATLWLLRPLVLDSSASLPRRAQAPFRLAMAAFLLSWIQWENLLSGMQVLYATALLGAVMVIRGLSDPTATRARGYVYGGLALAYLGSAHWLVLLPLILVQRIHSWRQRRRAAGQERAWLRLATVAALLLALVGLYLRQLAHPPHHPSPLFGLTHPFEMWDFLQLFYGNAFADGSLALPRMMGTVFIAASGVITVLAVRRPLWRQAPATGRLALWSLALAHGTALLVAIGRSGAGPEAALASRYTSVMLVGWLALLCTGLNLLWPPPAAGRQEVPDRRSRALAALVIGLPLGLGLALSAAKLVQVATWTMPRRAAGAKCLDEVLADPGLLSNRRTCLQTLYPDPDRLLHIAQRLRDQGAL